MPSRRGRLSDAPPQGVRLGSEADEGSAVNLDLHEALRPAAELSQVLLDAKFSLPQLRSGAVRRGDLIETARSSGCRLIAVTAPPGYGKSTFLAEWADSEDRPVAWLSLDRFDDDPATLLASLAYAYSRAGLGRGDLILGRRGHGVSVLGRAAPRLASEFRASRVPFVFMLDDLHKLQSPACHDVLGMMISALPPGSQVAATSRSAQPHVPRLRASGDALEFGVGDLTLDAAGTTKIFSNAGVSVSPELAAAVTERTEGWPAGLYLGALIAKESRSRTQMITGEDRYVADYLYREALSQQSKAVQRFLRRTAVLDQLCAPLCNALLGSSTAATHLRRVEARSLFMSPLDRQRNWYRYHALFQEFLLAELRRTEPDIIPTLHERAADWYESSGSPARAAEHLLHTTDWDRTTRLVTRLIQPTYMSGQLSTVQRWYRAIGDANIERYPPLAVLRCWEGVLTGDTNGAQRWVAVIDAASFDLEPADGAASFDSARAMVRAAMCATGPESMMGDATFAVVQEPASSPWRDTALWLFAEAHLLAGHVDEARAAFIEASAAAAAMSNFATIPTCESQLAWLAMDRGDWEEAAVRLEHARAVVDANRMHDYASCVPTFAAAARLSLRHGDLKEAHQQLSRAIRARPVVTYLLPYLAVRLRLQLAKLYLAVSDLATARRLLLEIDDILSHRPALGTLIGELRDFRDVLASTATSGAVGPLPLTKAELRLLPYLQTHLTADMIAERLFVSSHTVKTQVKAIYRKLGVTSRNDAVQKASAIGLVGV
jgi:LuxR family transcriptional regulator, maltose regulon positive regulatory protein